MGAPKINKDFFRAIVARAFINAVEKTVETYTGERPRQGTHEITYSLNPPYEVAGIVDFKCGGMDVMMMIVFDTSSICSLYESMLAEKVTSLTPEVQDCVGELANITYGNAKTPLSAEGYDLPMARPNVSLTYQERLKDRSCLHLPFETKTNLKIGLILAV
ncbi:MAG: chemotaxis protein CheX [Pseudobdellovibrionaceae bacterium]